MTPSLLAALDAAAELGKAATKRPWVSRQRDSGDFAGIITDSESRKSGKQSDICYMREGGGGPNGNYLVASANLDHAAIAQALRAAQRVVDQYEADSCPGGHDFMEAMDALRAALTPAAGADHA